MFRVCQFFQLDYSKIYERISMNFCQAVERGAGKKCLDFNGDSDFFLWILDHYTEFFTRKSFVFARWHHYYGRRFEISDRFSIICVSAGGTGFPGGPGSTGATGATGSTGRAGARGFQGQSGPAGFTGSSGLQGPPGTSD